METPMTIGEVRHFGLHGKRFDVRKLQPQVYSMGLEGVRRRRFGTLDEIREDLEVARQYGVLPQSKGCSWA